MGNTTNSNNNNYYYPAEYAHQQQQQQQRPGSGNDSLTEAMMMNDLSLSFRSLSFKGRQLFSKEMGNSPANKAAEKSNFFQTAVKRGDKRSRDERKPVSFHKEVREIDENDEEGALVNGEVWQDEDSEGEDVNLLMTPGQMKKKNRGAWTTEQDDALRAAVEKYEGKNWKAIAREVPGSRTHIQCLQRWGKVLKPGLVKGPWTEEEDELLKTYVPFEPRGNWVAVAEHIPGRTAKQCRERWSLCLDPNIRKDPWTAEEDEILLQLHDQHGNSWAMIAKHLPGRTENAAKSRFKSIERKRDRAWTPAEDATIIRGKAEERKWTQIASSLKNPPRTKNAVKTRWKELMEVDPSLKRLDSEEMAAANNHRPPESAAMSYPPSTYRYPQPMAGQSSPQTPSNTTADDGEPIDENGANFGRPLGATLSSDKLMNMKVQRSESFEEWLAKEAGDIHTVPMMMPNNSFNMHHGSDIMSSSGLYFSEGFDDDDLAIV